MRWVLSFIAVALTAAVVILFAALGNQNRLLAADNRALEAQVENLTAQQSAYEKEIAALKEEVAGLKGAPSLPVSLSGSPLTEGSQVSGVGVVEATQAGVVTLRLQAEAGPTVSLRLPSGAAPVAGEVIRFEGTVKQGAIEVPEGGWRR